MRIKESFFSGRVMVLALLLAGLLATPALANHAVPGISGAPGNPVFALSAMPGYLSTADGGSYYFWGYGVNGQVQYPGPTLIVTEGDLVTVTLSNQLPHPVSIVFPGQQVTAVGGTAGMLAREVPADNGQSAVTYQFTATEPGTYLYYSGSDTDLQVEMGLVGALIVRPQGFSQGVDADRTAYGDARSQYDQEYLFLLTDLDPEIHILAEQGLYDQIDTSASHPVYWFINGRTGPDTLAPAGADAPWLPTQPYDAFAHMTPGQRVLGRVVGAGREAHPFHTHGNNYDLIARDGRLLATNPADLGAQLPAEVGVVPDLYVSDFTQTVVPGATYDFVFTWTGRGMGWDIYGTVDENPHTCTDSGNGFDAATYEWCADHDKPLPVELPDIKDLMFGQFYSGSPYLGAAGSLPPGEGGFNPSAGYFYMWHSHNEKELTNNDIYPGGLLTMLVVEPPGTPIN